jgi:4-alpha-glucanotransferase
VAEARSDQPLDEAAQAWGVLREYQGDTGAVVRASDEAVLAALRELGAPVTGPVDVAAALRARRIEHWAELVEPVVVFRDADRRVVRTGGAAAGSAPSGTAEVRLLAGEADGAIECELTREDGSTQEWSVRARDLVELRAVEVEGREHVHGLLRLPTDLPRGYHQLTVRVGPRHARAHVIRAPKRAWTPEGDGSTRREWGTFLPLYALRTSRSHGVADLADLGALQEWTAARGGAVVGTLPLLAQFLDRPFDQSPYAPASRLFWNELYLDPERLPGLDRAPEARRLLASADYRAEAERLRRAPRVDHRAALALRRRVLDVIGRELAPAEAPLPVELAEFVGNRPEAEDYAAFRAIGEREGRAWRDWPGHTRAGSVSDRDFDEEVYRRHLYAQWAMDQQLLEQARDTGRARAPLYMDLPLGTHGDGFDVWRWRDLFADVSAGAPPDAFFAGGQDWGFPPVHPERARATGHAYWAASLRHLMRVSGMLRLDHVMGLHRLFWVPRGLPATQGVYVRYPADELYAVLCLESHRHRTEVVGEDLGVVADEVRRRMDEHRLRRMYVVPFELDAGEGRLAPQPPGSVASLDTHDMPPFAAYVADSATRAALARAVDATDDAPAALLRSALVRLAEGPARMVLVALEDLWLETEPQNRPGTASAENWTRKARHTLEELDRVEGLTQTLEAVDRARRATPRAPARTEAPRRAKAGS